MRNPASPTLALNIKSALVREHLFFFFFNSTEKTSDLSQSLYVLYLFPVFWCPLLDKSLDETNMVEYFHFTNRAQQEKTNCIKGSDNIGR